MIKVGDKVRIREGYAPWNAGGGNWPGFDHDFEVLAKIPNGNIFVLFPPGTDGQDIISQIESQIKHHGSNNGDFTFYKGYKKYAGRAGTWVDAESIERINMKDKLLEAGSDLGHAMGEGVAMAFAAKGVDYGYEFVAELLHQRFNISKEILNDPINQEIVKVATAALSFMLASAGEGHIPGAEAVKQGAKLVVKKKVADNAAQLINVIGPIITGMAAQMVPSFKKDVDASALEAALKEIKDDGPVRILEETAEDDSLAEALAEEDVEEKLVLVSK